jgi:hypothetical protein
MTLVGLMKANTSLTETVGKQTAFSNRSQRLYC